MLFPLASGRTGRGRQASRLRWRALTVTTRDFEFEGHRLVYDDHGEGDRVVLLPRARLVQASSILELRLTPERLTNEIVAFLDDCFSPVARAARGRREAVAGGRGSAPTRRPS